MRKYTTEQYPDETLDHYYRRLAKAADQRLVRLEKLEASGERGYGNVTKWAYKNAISDIQHFESLKYAEEVRDAHKMDIELAKRFNTAPPTNEQAYEAKIKAMKRFLEAKTSTKSSILSTYNKRAKTFNDKYKTTLTWEEIGNAYRSGVVDKLKTEGFGSDTIAKMLAKVKNDEEKLVKKANEQTQVTDDLLVNESIKKALELSGITEEELYDEIFGDQY